MHFHLSVCLNIHIRCGSVSLLYFISDYYSLYISCNAVDFLAEVGVNPGDDGVDPGVPLVDTTLTSNSDWQQISSDFPTGFALYTEALLDDYTGSIAIFNNDDLIVGHESFDSSLHMLRVLLPGNISVRAAIPRPYTQGSLQSIGVSVESKLLTMIVNCTVVNSLWLANMPSTVGFSNLVAYNPSTRVSVFQ